MFECTIKVSRDKLPEGNHGVFIKLVGDVEMGITVNSAELSMPIPSLPVVASAWIVNSLGIPTEKVFENVAISAQAGYTSDGVVSSISVVDTACPTTLSPPLPPTPPTPQRPTEDGVAKGNRKRHSGRSENDSPDLTSDSQ